MVFRKPRDVMLYKTASWLLALCDGNPFVTGGFSSQNNWSSNIRWATCPIIKLFRNQKRRIFQVLSNILKLLEKLE